MAVLIARQPQSACVAANSDATFTLTCQGDIASYDWQYSTDLETWTDIGLNSNTLTLLNVQLANSKSFYRCKILDSTDNTYVYSATVELFVFDEAFTEKIIKSGDMFIAMVDIYSSIQNLLNQKSSVNHNHDSRYYTKTAADAKFVDQINVVNTPASNDIYTSVSNIWRVCYGFHIDPNESDSYECVTYIEDAVGMTPAAMGSSTFNAGSWGNAFFIPKPCMLKYNGDVDYYLDPNDYSKKADGTPSDVDDLSYPGNAMVEFPLIWWKWEQGSTSGEGNFYVANYKVDDTFVCYSNMDCDGNIIQHFYMPIYNGCTYDGKMRSISGLKLSSWNTTEYSSSSTYSVGDTVNYQGKMFRCTTAVSSAEAFDAAKWEQFAFNGQTSGEEEIAQAMANNTTGKAEWYIDQWCDRVLIQGLLVLMGKNLDTQAVFGRGIDSGYESAKVNYVTGSLDDKGLFYGSTSNGSTAVKVFGMENYWALQWRRMAGLIGGENNTYLYKMTASTADGSTANGYNTTGSGYLTASGRPSEHNWLKKMQFGQFGALPLEVGSYSTQYYKGHYWTGNGYALFGGTTGYGSTGGAFYLSLNDGVGVRFWHIGAALSCKPCLKG